MKFCRSFFFTWYIMRTKVSLKERKGQQKDNGGSRCALSIKLYYRHKHMMWHGDEQMTKLKTGRHFIIWGTGTWALGTLSLSVF